MNLRDTVLGAPDIVFEQDVPDLATLEAQLQDVTKSTEFHRWTQQMTGLLTQSPKREIYQLME